MFGMRKVALCAVVVMMTIGLTAARANHKVLRGEAIYYSNAYAGSTMACGGEYQPWKMVAAHRKLPCGTRLKVKNKANGNVVIVKVMDRGPYGDPDTILDVSRKAAKKLDFISAGRTKVRAVVLHD